MSINIKKIFKIIGIAFLLEFLVFNFRHWESMIQAADTSFSLEYGKGLHKNEDGSYTIVDEKNSFVELQDIDAHINNLYLNFFYGDDVAKNETIPLQISVTDEGNTNYLVLPETEIVNGIKESQFLRLHLIGKSSKIKIEIKNYEGKRLSFDNIKVNVVRPFLFNVFRFCFILILLTLFNIFRPKSDLYKWKLNLQDLSQKFLLTAIISLITIFFLAVWYVFYDANWEKTNWLANLQYNYLAHSFLNGHSWLEFEVPESLVQMKNPYDTALRFKTLEIAGESAVIDFAYYKGKYYSYFGVIPVILCYLPYLLLTGRELNTSVLILLINIIFIFISFYFIYILIQKYFRRTSFGIYLLLASVFVIASEMLYSIQMSTLYSLPIAAGITLDLAGLSFWMRSTDERGGISKKWLTIGSICMSLVIGCRPQLCVATLFAFLIFKEDILKRRFFSKKGLVNTLCVIVPYLIIGMGVMYYNYIRFENPFDFGATYNLTGFDMTHRGFVLDRFWLGFFEYLFQPFRVIASFPYVQTVALQMGINTDFQGQVINEPLLAGYFAFNIIGFHVFGISHYRKELKKKGCYEFAVFSIISAVLILAVNIQMVGLTLRYLTDFSLFLNIAAWIIVLTISEHPDISLIRLKWIILVSGITILTNCAALLADGRYNHIRTTSPYVFYLIKYLLFIR